MVSRSVRLVLALLLLAVALTACQPPTAPPPEPAASPTEPAATTPEPAASPTEPATATPEQEAVAEPDTAPVLIVSDRSFTLAELQALDQVTTDDGSQGVGLLALLEAAGLDSEVVILTASDGYSANVPVADVDEAAALVYTEDGKLNAVIPTLPRNASVKDVIEIRVAEPIAEVEPKTVPEVAPLAEPLEIVDAAGRSITLTELPQRIMVVGRGPHMSLHILYMFDEGRQRLVGAESRAATPSDFLPVVDPAFSEIPTLAANPNVEQIAAMAPDLVIMKSVTEDATASGLAVLGIPVLYVDLETMDAFFEDLANIGAVLGNQARADEIAAFYRSRLESIDATLAEVKDADKPSVLLVSYSERGGEIAVQVPAAAWMQTAQIQRAGGDPIWLSAAAPTDGWTITNIEQIAQWNADKIFVVVHFRLDPQEIIDQLKADANWSALKAVQSGQLYAFPQDIFGWDQPEPRWILGVQWLATRIHPDLFADVDMDAEVRAWFGDLYGMDAAAIEQDIIPRVVMDVQ